MNWYYAEAGQQRGPVSEPEFQQLVAQGAIRPETLVWNESLSQWQPWSSLAPTPAPTPLPGESAPAVIPGSPGTPPASPPPPGVRCVQCQQWVPEEDTVALGGRPVCSACKPSYLQRMQEGTGAVGGPAVAVGAADTGTLSAEQITAQDYEIDAAGRIGEAWDFLTKPDANGMVVGVLIFLIFAGIQITQQILSIIPIVGAVFSLVGVAAAVFLIIPVTGGLNLAFLLRLRTGAQISVDQVFRFAFSERYWPMIGVTMLTGLLAGLVFLPFIGVVVAAGITLAVNSQGRGAPDLTLLIPFGVVGGLLLLLCGAGVYFLTTNWLYSLLLVADKRLPVTEAMRLSWRVVRRHWWQNFFLYFLLGLVYLAGILACGVGILIAQPVAAAAKVLQYERLFGRLTRYTR